MIYLKIIYLFILFFVFSEGFADTRTKNLPQGFLWRYIMDETEPTPRTGQYWRSGVLLEDKIIVLNTHNLIALTYEGKELWKRGLVAENPFSEAKIYSTDTNEIIVVITDALLRIDTTTGDLIDHYGYDVTKRAAFQMTEMLPRHSLLFQNHIYVFLGPQLLSFNTKTFERKTVVNFNSSPKTLPILYQDQIVVGLINGYVEFYDPIENTKNVLIYGGEDPDFSIRQPVSSEEFLYIPTTEGIRVYNNTNIISKSDHFEDPILSSINNEVWLRQHQKGSLSLIDQTLSSIEQTSFIKDKYATKINVPLGGNVNTLVHIDGLEGTVFIIKREPSVSFSHTIYSEEFTDNPPIQLLDQTKEHLLLGGFHGLYLLHLPSLIKP